MVKKNSLGRGWLFSGFSAAIAIFGKSYGAEKRKFALFWAVIICYNLIMGLALDIKETSKLAKLALLC